MPAELSQTIDELLETFDLLDGWDERYGYLIELGHQLPPWPQEAQTVANRVEGCLSTVWLASHASDSTPAD